ncbi:hypothetical protein [Nocardioides perillae]|uniref:Uncharacterized protein n=1 Tax=Nocardioides perillae TaxID=1119534 RepID=A0A7Y9UKI4_9ACTN|nr:hypothetical protein [Nocardioides perillae]NYG55423.1 hypothetical protein [Nocardioides perillae]
MKTTLRRTLAATAASAVAAAGTLAMTASPVAAAAADGGAKPVRTPFAFQANTSASRLVVDGIEPLALRLGATTLRCTQVANAPAQERGILTEQFEAALPEEVREIINSGPLSTSSRSYTANGGRLHVSESVSRLAGLELGGIPIDGFGTLPRLELGTVVSKAIAQHSKSGGYSARTDFSLLDFDLDLGDNPVTPQLQPILDLLEQVEAGAAPVSALLAEVEKALLSAGGLVIPNLGALQLRGFVERDDNRGALAAARPLTFVVDPDGPITKDAQGNVTGGDDWAQTAVELGRARAAIGGPVYGTVFRSHSVPLSVSLLGLEPLTFQSDTPAVLPCQGTGGQWVTRNHAIGSLLTQLGVISVGGAKSMYKGEHFARGRVVKGRVTNQPWSRGVMRTDVGEISIPFAGLTLTDLTTEVAVNTRKLIKVKNQPLRTYVQRATVAGKVKLGDQVLPLPVVGKPLEFTFGNGGEGILAALPSGTGRLGRAYKPLVLKLIAPGFDVLTMRIGEANIFAKQKG